MVHLYSFTQLPQLEDCEEDSGDNSTNESVREFEVAGVFDSKSPDSKAPESYGEIYDEVGVKEGLGE